jgi:hypothetical protein
MKIFDNSYVGVKQPDSDGPAGTNPLAFLTPYEDNAAGKKREETVVNWTAGRYYWGGTTDETDLDLRMVKNTPRLGFHIVGFASRNTTSNKLARVYDPEGYDLEISIDNLIEIMQHSTIINGAIQSKCQWARDGANNWLLVSGSTMEKNAIREGQVFKAEIGDQFVGTYDCEFVYLGRGYVQHVGAIGEETVTPAVQSWHNPTYSMVPSKLVTTEMNSKLVHVYLTIIPALPNCNSIETRVKPMKVNRLIGQSDYKWDMNTVFKASSVYHSSTGEFSDCRNVGWDETDPYHYYTRDAIFRAERFTADELDIRIIQPQMEPAR